MTNQRRTKIVCTIGPSTNSADKIEQLIKSGMNVARINFSHGSQEDHRKVIKIIRDIADRHAVTLPVLADLQGPKIRVGSMKNDAQELKNGQIITLGANNSVEGTDKYVPIDYKNLAAEAESGDKILMDDGLIELKVTKVNDGYVTAQVVAGGVLKSRKGVNLPGVKLSIPSLTEKDIDDLEFAIAHEVDFIALSFVRSAGDVQEVTSRLRAGNSPAGVIAKIEKPEAVAAIDEIIEEADGVMVARGDLGIEMASEKVPLIQKRIIDRCQEQGKPVITATQMLESMIEHPRATRAEYSDVANAVLDGSDAVMLSGETAIGKYPVEAVQAMSKICYSIEMNASRIYHGLKYQKPEWKEKQVVESIADSCVTVADNVDAKIIGTLTQSGSTARRIAKYRPNAPIAAFTESEAVRNQLNLVWGVIPMLIERITNSDESLRLMEQHLKNSGLVESGDRIILTTGIPVAKRGSTNMVAVQTVDSSE